MYNKHTHLHFDAQAFKGCQYFCAEQQTAYSQDLYTY